ncbi:hypothetical protein L5515_006067 [Caenorhabditis briggsae]|uniref:T20D4.11-like domain-containing protein n=1 Tax=Caenorhabditis briggsae TaxID=6238 RepID=A0AAE9CYN3_CAEBR|nr:hypothetical protein L3Y34_006240 [Caenorhabditis briggsae]UMM32169.1 hypothetical protein L5515_006067 [Caenorhabditis briggsae]
MLQFLLLFISFTLFYISNTASVDSSASGVLCSVSVGRDELKCYMRLLEMTQTTVTTDWKSRFEVEEFRTSCDHIRDCYESMKCRKNDTDILQARKSTKGYCDRMLFMSDNFPDCIQKLNNKNSQCWQKYIPVPGYSCTDIFGAKNCVKSDVEKICGKSEWIRFRDGMIAQQKSAHPDCNFDEFETL